MKNPDYSVISKIIAHRCNTLHAFKRALAFGDKQQLFYIECDIHMTKDPIVVVSHDAFFENQMIKESYYHQLGPALLRLDQLLELIGNHPVNLHIDVKADYRNDRWQAVVDSKLLFQALERANVVDQVVITTVAGDFLRHLRKYSKSIKLGVLYDEDYGTERPVSKRAVHAFIRAILDFHKEVGLEGIFLNQEWIQLFEKQFHCIDDFIYTMTKAGIKIAIWTVNDLDQAKKFLAWGVEWITTDQPVYFSGVIQNKKISQ